MAGATQLAIVLRVSGDYISRDRSEQTVRVLSPGLIFAILF